MKCRDKHWKTYERKSGLDNDDDDVDENKIAKGTTEMI